MAPFRLLRHLLVVVLLTCGLQACNLFNPSGEGTPDNVAGWIAEGDKQLIAKDYAQAVAAYRHALDLDGKSDAAWSGWLEARAGVAQQTTGIGLADLLIETRKIGNGSAKPFWSLSLEAQDRFYRYMGILDNSYAQCLRGLGIKTFTDEVRRQSYTSVKAAYTLLRLCDYDLDGRLTPSDTMVVNVCRDTPGGIESGIDVGSLVSVRLLQLLQDTGASSSGTPDAAKVTQLNALTASSDSLLTQVDLLAQGDPRWALLQQFLTGKGREMVFYAVSDAQDNDGDGCADEEVADGLDNDGDGLVDEDARLGYRDTLGSFQGAGALALRTTEDAVAVSRLVGTDAVTGSLRAGRNPLASDTAGLHYVSEPLWSRHPGLLTRSVPYVDSSHPDFATKHWKFRVEWTTAALDNIFLSGAVPTKGDSSDAGGARLSHSQLVDIRLAVRSISDPARRAKAGRLLVGGCWTESVLGAGRAR